jgi:hypothetical protein
VISGPAGKRNWDRFRSLFAPGARLIANGVRPTGEVGLNDGKRWWIVTIFWQAEGKRPF